MSGKRRRAVRLTDKAAEMLSARLVEVWHETRPGERLTRELRSGLLAVSVVTAEKILRREGVDKSSLIVAFRSLGMEWRDTFCETVQSEPEPEPDAIQPPPTRTRRKRNEFAFLFGFCLLAGGIGFAFARHNEWPSAANIWAEKKQFSDHMDVGIKSYFNGDYPTAGKDFAAAIALSEDYKDAADISQATRMMGENEAAQGDFGKALDLFNEALHLREYIRDEASYPSIREVMGNAEIRLKMYAEAERDYTHSLHGFRTLHDPRGIASACRGLGSLALARRQPKIARSWLNDGLRALNGVGEEDMTCDIQARLALVSRDEGDFGAALTSLGQCLDHWMSKRHRRWIATTEYQLATVYIAQGKRDRANDLLRSASLGYQLVGDKAGVRDCAEVLSPRYVATGLK